VYGFIVKDLSNMLTPSSTLAAWAQTSVWIKPAVRCVQQRGIADSNEYEDDQCWPAKRKRQKQHGYDVRQEDAT